MSARTLWTTRTLAGLGAVGVSLLMTAGPAVAHAKVERTTPGNGATIDGRLKAITIVFDDPVEVVPRSIVLTGSTGAPQTIGAPRVVDKHILQASLSDRLPDGRYLVGWRILSDDGHIESGSFGFTVTPSGAAPASQGNVEAGALPSAPGQPTWPVVVAAVMAAVACLGAALVVARGLAAVRAASVPDLELPTVAPDSYPEDSVVVIPASGRDHTASHR